MYRTLLALVLLVAPGAVAARAAGAPSTLAATGLYADFATRTLDPSVLAFAPQYPLWTDGAAKRRWIRLPPGAAIDAADPDVWDFPVGTRLWKEFSFGRPVETRYMERLADGSWLYATYLWSADGSTAPLAPPRGARGVVESAAGVAYDVPGTADCRACHGGHPATVLGFSALQLSADRDPGAPHAAVPPPGAVDLDQLVARGLVVGLPAPIAAHPPRVRAASPLERAALGYLHGNCSSCHNARGPLAQLGLSFAVRADGTPEALETAVGRAAHFRPAGSPPATVAAAGDPAGSLLLRRVGSRDPLLQMPPFGTRRIDDAAAALLTQWILAGPGRARPAPAQSELVAVAATYPKESHP